MHFMYLGLGDNGGPPGLHAGRAGNTPLGHNGSTLEGRGLGAGHHLGGDGPANGLNKEDKPISQA